MADSDGKAQDDPRRSAQLSEDPAEALIGSAPHGGQSSESGIALSVVTQVSPTPGGSAFETAAQRSHVDARTRVVAVSGGGATGLWHPTRGDRIGENGRFEILEQLGTGGMGNVFRAIDSHLDRTVAIKFILQNQDLPVEQLAGLLKREAKVTAKLNHENIVAIFDMDAYGGVPFLVMELLEGQSLDVLLERSRLTPARATRIMLQVARGLMHAHSNRIIHRDLKPSNVFVLRDGRAKVLDFGISRLERPLPLPPPLIGEVTTTLNIIGTPAYMAPEQWRAGAQDPRTDVWAAGVIFYQMLTGVLPYSPSELTKFRLLPVVRSIAPSVRLRVPTLPEEADRIVATALSEAPEGRYQTSRELWEALRELDRVLTGTTAGDDHTQSARQVERRPLTIMACCLQGVAGRDLEEVIAADDAFYRACASAVKVWGGSIAVPVGGRFYCAFGYPSTRETDAQHAVSAALQIADAMRELGPSVGGKFGFKIGIHSGPVGVRNALAGGFPSIQGDVPNVASALLERAAPDTIVLSPATHALTGGAFATAPIDDSPRARAYEVRGEAELVSRFEQTVGAQPTPFVGRDRELRLLRQLWEEAKAGRGRMVVVSGDPGIGKSRLVQALKDWVIDEQNTRLTCQCRPQFKNSALRPLIELITRSMDIRRDHGQDEKLAKIEAALAGLGFPLAQAVPLVASLLSVPFEHRYSPLDLSPEMQKVRTLETLVSMLQRTTGERPTLLIFEDMHWVDHSTIEYLNILIHVVTRARLLVVLTCRPEFRAPWSDREHLHHLVLDRLPSDVTVAMIEHASRDRKLPPSVVSRLVATTDGVPLFVEELTRLVVESWRPEAGWIDAGTSIPGTLHELLVAKLDRLDGTAREVAQFAAVLGRDFPFALVRAVSPVDEMSLQSGLESLVDAGVLYRQGKPPNAKYLFKHALIQQTAYQSLAKSERQQHHRRAADVLGNLFPETVDLEPELLAYHHAEAGNTEQAIVFWQKAGQRTTQRSALVEAIDHYGKALDALKTLPPGEALPGGGVARDKKELALLLALGSPLMSVYGYASAEVERTYARARELAHAAGGQSELFPAMLGLWQFYYVKGMLATARSLGEQLLAIARDADDSTFELLALRAVASTVFVQGDFESCLRHTSTGLAIYDVAKHGQLGLRTGHDPGVANGVYRGWALWIVGYPDQALGSVTQAIVLARELCHPLSIAYALCFATLVHNHRGDHDAALTMSGEALAITGENQFALWNAWARMQRGWALCGLGDTRQGIPEMRAGLEGWKQTGARVGFTVFPVTLAELCLRVGRLDDTRALLEEATPMVERNGEHFYEAELLRLKGELAVAMGGEDSARAARALFADGLAVAEKQRAKAWELRTAVSLARHQPSPATRRQLAEVCAFFGEGARTADVRAARALLEEGLPARES
jgi:TOMM system kinase/cyclase fusion protein